jgi:DNA-binding NarL/FixJ family response regulator
LNLLIVDDHAGMRELIRHLAREIATQIRECASGEEAVELCKSYAPDCVTMDLRMGAMDGLTATQLIREAHPFARIAIVSQFEHEQLRARALQAGANSYIRKDDLEALKRHVMTPLSR